MFTPAQLSSALRRSLRGVSRSVSLLIARCSGGFTPRRRRELCAGTGSCGEALLQFGRASDKEFTALAQGLSSLNNSLMELRGHCTEFQLILEDRDEERPIESAQEIYKRSIDLVHSSIGIAVAEQGQMQGIEAVLLGACGASAKFRRNQILLRMITMSIRMEAARMKPENQALFANVGDAIGDISAKITLSTEAAFQRIEAVLSETATERGHLHGIETDLHANAQSSIRTIQKELTSLKTALAPCAEQGREIGENFSKAEALTMRTMGSLQHQDIVRQQLEHVAAGFNDLHEHLLETTGINTAATRLELGYIHHAAGVQQAHLRSARAEIEHATSEVVGGLQAILETSTALVEGFAAMEVAGSAAFADFRIVVLFREKIGELARVADRSKIANDKIALLVDRIEEVVRVFAEEVGRHELDVKIVALNAQIASARVPSAEAISRLAEESRRVSDENTEVTRELLSALENGLVQLRAIKQSAEQFLAIVSGEKAQLEAGVEAVTGKLTRLRTRVQSNVAAARNVFEAAHKNTRSLLGRLQLAGQIAESFPPAEDLCTRLLEATTAHADGSRLSEQAHTKLEAHRDRYTMSKENSIHATALVGAPDAAAEPPVATTTAAVVVADADDKSLGDGIELF